MFMKRLASRVVLELHQTSYLQRLASYFLDFYTLQFSDHSFDLKFDASIVFLLAFYCCIESNKGELKIFFFFLITNFT